MDKIDSLLNNARSLCSSGKLDQAKLIYLSLIESNKISPEVLTNLGNIELQTGNIKKGVEWLEKSIKLEQNQPQTLSNLGIALMELERPSEAIAYFNQAIKTDPYSSQYQFNLAIAHEALQAYKDAINSYKQSIQLNAKFIDAYINLGNVYSKLNNFDESIKQYQIAINLNPYHIGAYLNIGIAYRHANKIENAIECFKKAIDLDVNNFEAYLNLGLTYEKTYRFLDAIPAYLRAKEINSYSAAPYINLASCYTHLNKLDEAIKLCQQAIKLNKSSSEAYVNLGNVYKKRKQYDQSINQYDLALNINPSSEEAYLNKSLAYLFLHQYQKAIEMNKKAMEINPKSYECLTNFALIYKGMDNYDEAINLCQLAIDKDPKPIAAYLILGELYAKLGRHQNAIELFEIVIKIKNDSYEAFVDIGNICILTKNIKKAIEAFDKALLIEPAYYVAYLHCKSLICSWNDFDLKKLRQVITETNYPIVPFMSLNLIDDGLLQKKIATENIEHLFYFKNIKPQILPFHKKVRIAYFSPDFHSNHPVAHLTQDLFANHDRSKFEIYFFSFIPENNDSFQSRIKKSCDEFIDVSSLSDESVASLAREKEVDIAIDLSGYTQGSRTTIFSRRAAPIQINYLGYPGTMGASFIDYIIADEFIIPEDKQDFYTEKVIYLPGCFQPNNYKKSESKNIYNREDEKLPQEGFVFCSFNSTFKLMPSIFNIWMRVLNKVEGSVLWLASCQDEAKTNLRNEAIKRGVDHNRLIFADRKDLFEDHLERLKLADLFLDSFPYNAHTTASDALRSEVPLLTITGESFAARVAGSLLNSLDLTELIVDNEEAYEAMAIQLGSNSTRYLAIKEKLKYKLSNADLFNTELYTKNLEKAYEKIYQRYLNSRAPEHLII